MESQAVRKTVIGAMTLAATYSVLGIETAQARDEGNVDPAPAAKPTAQPEIMPVAPVVPTIAPPEGSRQPVFTRLPASIETTASNRPVPTSLQRLQETRLNPTPINREAIFKSAPESADNSGQSALVNAQSEKAAAPEPSAELDAAGAAPAENATEALLLPTATADRWERSDRVMTQSDEASITQRFVAPARVTLSQSAPILTDDLVAAGAMAEADLPAQYQVQKGDTLHKIANSLGVTLESLVVANDIADPNLIIAGVDLVLPTARVEADPGAETVEGAVDDVIDEKAVLETLAETTEATPSVEVSQLSPEQLAPSERLAELPSGTAQRLARLQATASRPVDSVTLLSQLQGSPVLPGADEAIAPNASDPAAALAIEETAEDAVAELEMAAEPMSTTNALGQLPEQPDVYLASLLDSVSEASTDYTAAQVAEPVEVANALVDQSTETLLAVAPLDNAEWIRRQAPRAGDAVEATTPLLPGAHEYLPQPSDAFNGYVWPTRGTLTSGYGWRWGRMHRGVDIAAPIGTPVMAAAPGVVEYAQWNSGGYGNLVDIRHADGSLTRYAHNNRLVVRPGQRVQQGQLIAEMGSTGRSTGPHLHFEIHPANSGATNPLALLPERR
ncbi:MAG: LysM peptidoglycan-binding domain-containing M23 family metallopeptidase [Cyanobacteria bacterium J06635_1]